MEASGNTGGVAYDRSVSRVAAFVLAGGKSSRMGRDKAFLRFGEEALLVRTIRLASTVAESVSVVGDAEKFAAFGRVENDTYRDCGPLGGIHAALAASTADLNLILAVDLPFLEQRFLEFLIAEAQRSDALVTVPHSGGRFQTLCALYRREFVNLAEDALKNGRNKIDLLFSKVELRIITEQELTENGFTAEMFRNLNTPEDLEQALKKIQLPK